ncbi:hypothetical protein [Streptomyces venezuelae]|uniref:hypothetical protein n=1 Tax=Streptomyces venezuelae TaxID=54571 RepID=UPI00366357F7
MRTVRSLVPGGTRPQREERATSSTMRRAAVAGTAALALGLGAVPATADGQGNARPDRAPSAVAAAQQKNADRSEVQRSIPWKKRGAGKVKKCARHGTKYEFKVKLHNTCDRKYTYHLEIVRGPDRCKTVPKGRTRTVDWQWPGRLEKVRNGGGGRC